MLPLRTIGDDTPYFVMSPTGHIETFFVKRIWKWKSHRTERREWKNNKSVISKQFNFCVCFSLPSSLFFASDPTPPVWHLPVHGRAYSFHAMRHERGGEVCSHMLTKRNENNRTKKTFYDHFSAYIRVQKLFTLFQHGFRRWVRVESLKSIRICFLYAFLYFLRHFLLKRENGKKFK